MTPLYVSVPKALKQFNFRQSFPKNLLPSFFIMAGLRRSKTQKPHTAITFSVNEDYARIWLHFAQRHLPASQWHFLIVDCAGNMKKNNFPGAELVRFMNLPHGRKIDIFLNKFINSPVVFLSDDDKYILSDLSGEINKLNNPKTAVISLSPRNWYKLNIQGREFLPMGSYAIVFKREVIKRHRLSFMSLKKEFPARVVEPGAKKRFGYDTADMVNEKLIGLGYEVITKDDGEEIKGFDGSTTPRIFTMMCGKELVLRSLAQAPHYKKGSTNGSQLRGLYSMVKIEQLFEKIFKTKPSFLSGITEKELIDILTSNEKVSNEEKTEALKYFEYLNRLTDELTDLS